MVRIHNKKSRGVLPTAFFVMNCIVRFNLNQATIRHDHFGVSLVCSAALTGDLLQVPAVPGS